MVRNILLHRLCCTLIASLSFLLVTAQGLDDNQLLRQRLDVLMRDTLLETTQLGMMVWDLDADSAIFKRGERQLLRPASTEKVLTAVTAIDCLGGDFQFKTELRYVGLVQDRVLEGDIYCVGGFDPCFNMEDMQAFVESVRALGIDTIRGHVYADKSAKDFNQYGEGWCWDDDNPVLTPLLYNRRDIFLETFMGELSKQGIVLQVYSGSGQRPEGALLLCRRVHTLDEVLLTMMKESDNLYAESVFYQLGRNANGNPATAKSSAEKVKDLIKRIGLDASQYSIADGSGLSLYNYVSAELEVMVLRHAARNEWIDIHLRPSLPIAGEDGTLKRRMVGTSAQGNVRAKTGSLRGVSSLAGYCTAANGHRLCFSIINQGVRSTKHGRDFQDKVCEILTR